MNEDINVLALVKGEERYIFLFDDANRTETLRTLGRYASNSELSFSWYDAAVLSQKIRKISPAHGPPKPHFKKGDDQSEKPRFELPHSSDSFDSFDEEQ